ncbi:MAG: FecR domain-containing protein [Bacteroidota bacterium]
MKITPELLKKYAADECSEKERLQVQKWLNNNEDLSTSLPKQKIVEEQKLVWQQIAGNMAADQSTSTVPLYKSVAKYAAAAIILFTIGFFSYQNLPYNFRDGSSESLALKTINTQRGEKRTVTLPDGSTIRMNYETEIRIPEQFEGNERIVYLTGHAHFEVTRDTQRPFIIYTEDSKTQVLGTSFDINTKSEGETEIIVTSGKVAFSEKEQEENLVTLTVNDRAILNANRSIATDKVDAFKLTAWKDNRLVFNGETLQEVIQVLEPWYNVSISVEDPDLLSQDFKYEKDNPTLKVVLDKLAFMGRFEYRLEGDSLIIY